MLCPSCWSDFPLANKAVVLVVGIVLGVPPESTINNGSQNKKNGLQRKNLEQEKNQQKKKNLRTAHKKGSHLNPSSKFMWRKGCPAGSSLFLKSVNSMAAPLRDGHHEKHTEKIESITMKRLIDKLCHLLANEVPCPGRYPFHQANSQSHPSNWSMLVLKITKMITLGLMTLRTDLMKLFSSPSSTSARYPPTCTGCPLAIWTRHGHGAWR